MTEQKNDETAVTIARAMDSEEALVAILDKEARGNANPKDIREQMGNQEPKLERIEVKHSGANMFVFPDGNPVPGDKGFAAVILASNFHNAKYAHAFDDPAREENERPECKSSDGVNVDAGVPNPQAQNCSFCPLNCSATSQQARDIAFSKDRDERCQNRLSLVLMVPGSSIPFQLNLSPSSFKTFAGYAQRVGSSSRFLLHEVATKITSKKTGQFGHSEVRFEYIGALPPELREANEEAHASYLAYLRRTATQDRVDEAEGQAEADAEKEASTPDEAPL